MSKKRGQNEGSIVQRKDGRWEGKVCLGFINGKLKRKSLYGKTRKEVQEKLTQTLRTVQQGLPVITGRKSVETFLNDWLETVVKPSTRPKTYHSYKQIVRLHLIPGLGRFDLSKLTALDVQRFLNEKQHTSLSPRTVLYLRDVLRNALNQAVKWDLVPRNVAELTEGPKARQHQFRSLTPQEAQSLLAVAGGHRLEALFTVALAVGLRIGEALGLRWNDIDLNAKSLTVNNQLQKIDGVPKLVEPKSSRGRRVVALPAFAVTALQDHRKRQEEIDRATAGDKWIETGFVFTSDIGSPLDDSNVRRILRGLLEKAQLPHMRFHDLRHTCASLLLAQKVAPRVVMEILGHSQISLTMNTYSHVMPALEREAADLMDSLISVAN